MQSRTLHYLNITSIYKLLIGVLCIFASAQITIPIGPVPITLQTLAVSVIAFYYSPRESFLTVSLYLICGIAGFPLFKGYNSGITYMFGPTGGYFFGMLITSYLLPYLKSKYDPRNYATTVMLFMIAQISIYVPGILWLATITGISNAFIYGFLVFIPSGVIKILILGLIVRYIKPI